jgi:hypothetical protein
MDAMQMRPVARQSAPLVAVVQRHQAAPNTSPAACAPAVRDVRHLARAPWILREVGDVQGLAVDVDGYLSCADGVNGELPASSGEP